ncbi:ubiquitin carboxyl-terminal hydrolase 37 isoform X1 [Lepeophtheirus salmonis]|uniref:ubiquitin carboxyl-terminal hydrolase 37 isoform X1 n=2 Tax=Lepeophtheirus salmonis TaxID=72036 RepID=UPI001AE21E4D|nr:ubiquitin carboxyl-terminal hydrolase 37-like isoform X1 [Lepeophtheirus salmonis]
MLGKCDEGSFGMKESVRNSSPGILRRVLESPQSIKENDENNSPKKAEIVVESPESQCKEINGNKQLFHSTSSFYESPSKSRFKTYPRRCRSSPLGAHNTPSKPYATSKSLYYSSPERTDSKKNNILASHRIGFPNIYQTCYLNAILQCLLSQPSFVQGLLDIKSTYSGRVPALLKSFCALAEAKECGNQSLVSKEILKLKNILSNLDSTFKGNSMHDADEFLLKFCDTLREQCKSLQASDPITENIEYEVETIVTCSSCGLQSSMTSKNLICTLSSPVDDNKRTSIGGLLENTFSASKIDQWSCEKCGIRNGSAILTSSFKTLPRVLILHVPRSNYDSHSDVKNHKIQNAISIFENLNLSSLTIKDVVFPEKKSYIFQNDELWSDDDEEEITSSNLLGTPEKLRNLSKEQIGKLNEEDSLALAIRYSLKEAGSPKEGSFNAPLDPSPNEDMRFCETCDLDTKKSINISYQLASIVSHLGSSASSGHYIADVFRFDRKAWFRYNDMNVFRRNFDSVKSDENMRNGYLFIYTHCQLLSDL